MALDGVVCIESTTNEEEGGMTEQQAERLRWAFDQNEEKSYPHMYGWPERPRVYHVRDHPNGLASLNCKRCRRSVIAYPGGGLTGSAATTACLL